MDLKIRTEVKIGFIVLSTIILVVWGINFLQGRNVLKRTDVYYVVYNNVQGLEFGAPVYINGFKVGLINDISFDIKSLDRFIVAFVVEKQYNLPVGSVVTIGAPDLISGKALQIDFAQSDRFHAIGDTLTAGVEDNLLDKLQANLEPLLLNAGRSAMHLDSLLSGINRLMDEESINQLKGTIRNTEELTSHLNAKLSPTGDVTSAIENLRNFTETLNDNKVKLANIITNASDISDTLANSGLGETLVNINETTAELNQLLNSVNSGEGTLGLLAGDDSLYIKLVDVSTSLDLLLQDMRESPGRFVHFSIFGRKDKN